MTDNEIIKAVGCCIGNTKCDECPMFRTQNCMNKVFGYALDLINRQKAENERLRTMNSELNIGIKKLKEFAIKEFVKLLKDRVVKKYAYTDVRIFNEIDNIVKEMTEVGK